MPAESDQPQQDLERSTEVVVTYGPEAVGRVRKVTTWVAGKAVDGTAKVVQVTGKGIQFAGKGVQAAGTGISAVGTGISSTLGAIPYVGIPFRVLGAGINGVGKGVQFFGKGVEALGKGIESAGKGLEKLKQGIGNLGQTFKSVKNISQLAKVAGGPVGLAMLALNSPLVKRIAKGIAALIAYLLLKFGLKFAGAILGAAFGAVTGLPLLAIPVAGPFLYAGWVGFWGWRGWNNPMQMIRTVQTATHYATHPWELITKPLAQGWGYAKGAFNTVTGGPISVGGNIGSAVSGFVSTVGSGISAGLSAIWGGITGAAGGAFSVLSSATSFVVGGLGSLSIPASVAMIPVVGGVGAVIVGGTLVGITTATSFFSPRQDAVIGGTGDNEYFTLSKSPDKQTLLNSELPHDLTYTMVITAKANITDIVISDKLEVQGTNGTFSVAQDKDGKTIPSCPKPTTLAADEQWNCQFTIEATNSQDHDFANTIATNTLTVTATQAGKTPMTDSVQATTIIGAPPTGCPTGWPTKFGAISTGVEGSSYHVKEHLDGWPAIDIAVPRGTDTYPTFTGRIKELVYDRDGGGFGVHVIIEGDCRGTHFEAMWAHLLEGSIPGELKVGDTVDRNQVIGQIDDTGTSFGDHLHYAFNGLEMEEPNIPISPDPYCNDTSSCGVVWPVL